jgi:hypothetical protein
MMRLWKKIKGRFKPDIEFEIDDATLMLALQLGWVEKFLGKWQFTDKGQEEFTAFIKEYHADIRS